MKNNASTRQVIELPAGLTAQTRSLAILAIQLVGRLPRTAEARELGRHLLAATLSLASNYRAASQAKSGAEFFQNFKRALEAALEGKFWLDVMEEAGACRAAHTIALKREMDDMLCPLQTSETPARHGTRE